MLTPTQPHPLAYVDREAGFGIVLLCGGGSAVGIVVGMVGR